MKIILAQPAILRFQWELDVALTSIRNLDADTPIVLLFTEENMGVIKYFEGRYPNLEIHHYEDDREDKSYIPTIRPFLMWRYFSEDPARERDTYFQIDADVIFREMPPIIYKDIGLKKCIASDCGGYIDYKYLMQCRQGEYIVNKFSEMLAIPVEVIKNLPGGGAQWLISNPTAGYWWHVWKDSAILYHFLEPIDSNIQKWTAEMWAQLYNLPKFGYSVELHRDLEFIRPTDPIEWYDKAYILHNAGVVGTMEKDYFYKGRYVDETPFGKDFSHVDKTKAGLKYVEAINSVVL